MINSLLKLASLSAVLHPILAISIYKRCDYHTFTDDIVVALASEDIARRSVTTGTEFLLRFENQAGH
jgi:hypothetical protein